MTGAGAATVAFAKGTGFDTIAGSPTYYLPGRNPVVEELSLSNTLQRLRTPTNAEAVDSLAGRLDGAFGIAYSMSSDTHDDVRDIVFNSGGTGFATGLAATSRWFLGLDFLNTSDTEITVERVLHSCIPLEYAIAYRQGTNTIRETLTMGYADEERNTSVTPGTITSPSDGNDVPFHGATLTLDNSTVSRLQSATLRWANMYRFVDDNTSRFSQSAHLANPTATLETNAIIHTRDYLEYAYGGATGTTSPQDTLATVSNSDLAFDIGGTVLARYNMSKLKADNTTWQDLVNADADTTERIVWHVNGATSIATS